MVEKYKVVWEVFFSSNRQVHAEGLTKEEAEALAKKLNISNDAYEKALVIPE